MKLTVICYGNAFTIVAKKSDALDVVIERAWKKAAIAERYRQSSRWELRTWSGQLLEPHRSVGSYNFGNGAKLSLMPAAGHGG